jgi:hypothetical protein
MSTGSMLYGAALSAVLAVLLVAFAARTGGSGRWPPRVVRHF